MSWPDGNSGPETNAGVGECLGNEDCNYLDTVNCWPYFNGPTASGGYWQEIANDGVAEFVGGVHGCPNNRNQGPNLACTAGTVHKISWSYTCSCCPSPTSPNPGCEWCINNVLEGCPVWNTTTCSWQCQAVSPIIINIDGAGWDLTNAQNGVLFDFFGNGDPIQMSWTALGSHNAFLALDRNHNGIIDGKDLFGNITQQPYCRPDECNGFAALAVFDQPDGGGNGNGMIDPGDAIWAKLLLWFDRNHDGIAQPSELVSLSDWNRQNPSMTINAFDLHYRPTNHTDANGNKFRFCAQIFGPGAGRITCDVFLTAATSPPAAVAAARRPQPAGANGAIGRPGDSRTAAGCPQPVAHPTVAPQSWVSLP